MNLPMTSNGVHPPLIKRARNTVPLAAETSKEAKRVAAAILEVLAGGRTPQQAADALQMSLPRYYQVEARGLRGLLAACEARPKGRQADPGREVAALQRQIERLQRDLTRQQSLVRLGQRTIGLTPPASPAAKANGKKARKRKPVARALTLAARLKQEADQGEPSSSETTPAANAT